MVIHLVCHSFIGIRQKLSLVHLVIHTINHTYQRHWNGSWHCTWWWCQSSPSPCHAGSCTLEEFWCLAQWSSLTTYKRWHAIPLHHPEIPPEQQAQVLLKRQWGIPTPIGICLLLYTIHQHQGRELVVINQLPVVHHEVDHHPPKIMIRKVGGLLWCGCAHQQWLLYGHKQTITSPIYL